MVVKMDKITLLGMEYQRKELIKALMELGVIEITAIDEKDYKESAQNPDILDELSRVESELADIDLSLKSLDIYCPVKKGLFKSRREVTLSEFSHVVRSKDEVWNSIRNIQKHEEELINLKTRENRLNNLYLSLLPWKGLNAPLQTTGTEKTLFLFGTIPSTVHWELIDEELPEKAPFSFIRRINSDKDQHYLYVLMHKDNEQACMAWLKSYGFSKVTFSDLSGSVTDNIKDIEKKLQEISVERDKIIDQIKNMKDDRESIEVLYDSLLMEKGRIEATGKILETKKAFFIKGWIPERNSENAKKNLEKRFIVDIEIIEPEEQEKFPVLVENKGIAEAVEPVTSMYSLPDSREIDPNKVTAPFFILFFGLMLSDGGYGIVLSLLSGLILWRFKLEHKTRKFMKLMFYCGIATIFWGAMFGGWFGISALVPYALWFDMVNEPELMLSWSLLFGVIHMFVGLAVKAANLIRKGKYLDALYDAGFWYIFFTGAVFFLLPYVPEVDPVKSAPFVSVGKYLLIIGGVLLILTQGRNKKNIIGKFFGGLSSLYDLVGFMSDVLSYSRLLALGLATSIIASIVNDMSVMFDMPIVIKAIMAVAILLVGHIINFAINALGAYVHSCRLQYLEFFGKFFKGGGDPFIPLKENTKYITLKSGAGM